MIEVGAQTNTYEEAVNAMDPLAQLLDQVLTGCCTPVSYTHLDVYKRQIGICTITKDVVEGKSAPELVYRDNTVPRKSFTGRSKKDRTGEIA